MDKINEQTTIAIPKIILITGGSCSGKTSFSNFLSNNLDGQALIIQLDNYFADYSTYSPKELDEINFDIPEAFCWDMLIDNINDICSGQSTQLPEYDFSRRKIGQFYKYSERPDFIIIEGIMSFENLQVFEMASIKIFVDTPLDIMLWRRISRDGIERFFDVNSTLLRYKRFIRNSYINLILPHRETADIVIDGTSDYERNHIHKIMALLKR